MGTGRRREGWILKRITFRGTAGCTFKYPTTRTRPMSLTIVGLRRHRATEALKCSGGVVPARVGELGCSAWRRGP